MRKITFIILCAALCVSLALSSPQEQDYYSGAFARLNYVKGDVFIQRAEDMGYEEGTVNLPIVRGDKLGTREGRAEIHFGRKNYLRVDQNTQVDFVNLPQREDDMVSLHLFAGNIYLRINSLNVEKEFEVHSPDGSFYVLEEGLYRFDVREDRETAVTVVEGAIEAAGEEGFEIVRGGEFLMSANGFFTAGPDYVYAANEDMFAEWNRGRDVFHNRYVRTRYLPVDMYEYEAELDYYGRWVYERPYGYVWVPDVYHSSWRPYYHGRWIWYPVSGWTWCSYEPWGWCVSHYGRWHWRGGLGWYWIPTSRWGPAWVHWYSGYDYIGWCPLSYYNRPVVIVNNNFYDRYNDTYYPAHSRAFTVLRKDQLSARQVSKVALDQTVKTGLGKISLSANQPNLRPASAKVPVKGSVASEALSRSKIRSVSKSYSSNQAIRSSTGKGLINPSSSSRTPIRSGTSGKNDPAGSSVASRLGENRSLRSAIKTYPARNETGQSTGKMRSSSTGKSEPGINSGISRSTARSSSSRNGIKTYPSQRSSSLSSRRTAPSEIRGDSSRSSRSYTSTLRRYAPSSSPSSSSRSSAPSSRSSSTAVKRYSSQSRFSTSQSPSLSRPYSSSRSATRSTPGRSYSSITSRSDSRIRTSSPRSSSPSPSRISPSNRSSSSRSVKSMSRAPVSRSSPSRSSASRTSSRSTSAKKVKKK